MDHAGRQAQGAQHVRKISRGKNADAGERRTQTGQSKETTIMKLKTKLTKMTLFAGALLTVCFSANSAHAQSAFEGKFTLQHETRWDRTMLPPGDYVIALDRGDSAEPAIAVIRDAATGKRVAMVSSAIVDTAANGENALLTASRENQWVVYSFQVGQLKKVFVYDRALAHGRATEAKTQIVPIIVAKK
jgi:hypothetical protein